MKKKSHYCIIFVIAFTFILSLTLNAHATNGSDLQSLQQVMGIQPDGDYAEVDLATTPEGSVIMATVEDPSQIGGCLKGDRVELVNLGNGEWKITRLVNGSGFQFIAQKEDGVMKITKTETFGQKVTKPAGQSRGYISFKAGIFSPESDDLEGFDTGFNGEIALGLYFNPNFAAEFGVGYLKTEYDESGSIAGYDITLSSEIMLIPITLTLKGIIPINKLELFAGAGIGLYVTYFEAEGSISGIGRGSWDDWDTSFGPNVNLGAIYNINEKTFIGIEGKYLWADIDLPYGMDLDIEGYTATANIGFRF
jgi:outer membrane protein W